MTIDGNRQHGLAPGTEEAFLVMSIYKRRHLFLGVTVSCTNMTLKQFTITVRRIRISTFHYLHGRNQWKPVWYFEKVPCDHVGNGHSRLLSFLLACLSNFSPDVVVVVPGGALNSPPVCVCSLRILSRCGRRRRPGGVVVSASGMR